MQPHHRTVAARTCVSWPSPPDMQTTSCKGCCINPSKALEHSYVTVWLKLSWMCISGSSRSLGGGYKTAPKLLCSPVCFEPAVNRLMMP